eukprot:c8827_g1_i2.p1 GENE.c8827_g1_i2~~c8827_g1_i2.p1  ORF type:complete len:370 (-),score=75.07 c8827_g1_i2:49-1158(-)
MTQRTAKHGWRQLLGAHTPFCSQQTSDGTPQYFTQDTTAIVCLSLAVLCFVMSLYLHWVSIAAVFCGIVTYLCYRIVIHSHRQLLFISQICIRHRMCVLGIGMVYSIGIFHAESVFLIKHDVFVDVAHNFTHNFLENLRNDPIFYPSEPLPPVLDASGKYFCANLNCTWDAECFPHSGPQCCSWVNLKILLAWNATATKYNISYSLMFGTLLGAIRDQSIMPWTDDTDVIVSQEHFDKFSHQDPLIYQIHEDLSRKGFNFYSRGWTRLCVSNNTNDPFIKPYLLPYNGTTIRAPYMDIFPPNHKWKHCDFSFPTTRTASVNSFHFPIMDNAEECLEIWYTRNWMIRHVRFQGGGNWNRTTTSTTVRVRV